MLCPKYGLVFWFRCGLRVPPATVPAVRRNETLAFSHRLRTVRHVYISHGERYSVVGSFSGITFSLSKQEYTIQYILLSDYNIGVDILSRLLYNKFQKNLFSERRADYGI